MIKKFIILFLFCNLTYGQVVIDSYKYVVTATQDPDDVYPLGQADSWNDVLSIGSWLDQGSGVVTTEAVSGNGNVITITSTDGTASQGGNMFISGLPSGADIDAIIDYRVETDIGSTQAFRAWSGCVTSPDFTMNDDGNWHEETFTIKLTSTTLTIRGYSTRLAASGANVVQIKRIQLIIL